MFAQCSSKSCGALLALVLLVIAVAHCPGTAAAADDYTMMWWADGFHGRTPDGQWRRVIQTSQYALVLDVQRMAILHLGRVANPLPYSLAVHQDNSVWSALPAAQLDLEIEVDGVTYRCTQGGPATDHDGPRIIESGRFVQRADVTNLVFQSADGNQLPVHARFETLAWPDRVTLLLEASPQVSPIRAGETFGRAGGGYGLDGTNHLDCPLTAAELPARFSLACWVYLPPDFCATQYDSWILCLQGNEWVDGHVGVSLGRSGAPRAVLDIGGGRDNCVVLVAQHADGRQRVLETERWHHLALTYDGSQLTLYVDGQTSGSQVVGKERTAVDGTLTIGRRGDNAGDGYHLRGVVDELQLYGRSLDATEIAQLSHAPPGGVNEAPLRVWSFNPAGAARERRETEYWKDAALTLRLHAFGKKLERRVQSRPNEVWTEDDTGRATISLDFNTAEPASSPLLAETVGGAVKVVVYDAETGAAVPAAYDVQRGWIRIDLNGITKQGDENDRLERVRLRLENQSDQEQPVRLLFDKTQDLPITGMSAILRDEDRYPTGQPVQLSKNWHRSEQRRLAYEGPWFHAFTYLRLRPKDVAQLELVLAGAHWGGVAAASHAQLCLVGWGSNQLWDQTALGSWGENFCFEPDRAQASALVCDVRPLMVHAMNNDQPTKWSWTNNVGGGDMFRLFAKDGTYVRPTRMKTAYLRHGPCRTEVVYAGTLCDGAADHSVTTTLYRTDDMARCIYRLQMGVIRPVEYSRFVILQIGADTYGYTRERLMAAGNASGLVREWRTQWGGDCYRTEPMLLEGRVPWVSMHDAQSRDPSRAGAWANRGLVIRAWRARLGGKECGPWLAEHGIGAGDQSTSTADILPPKGVQRLEPGDFIDATIEHIVVPQFARDYYGPNERLRTALRRDENTWHMVHREAVGNDLLVQASVGKVEQTRPVVIRTVFDHAEFSITGGTGYIPVTIRGLGNCGLGSYRAPQLEWKRHSTDENWNVIDQATRGNDFWQTDFDLSTHTWEHTFTVPADLPDDRREQHDFRFTHGRH